jgi:hypothetical protein
MVKIDSSDREYLKLSALGLAEHRKMRFEYKNTWLFWTVLGSLEGLLVWHLITKLPIKKSKLKIRKYQITAFGLFTIGYCYYGYKRAN